MKKSCVVTSRCTVQLIYAEDQEHLAIRLLGCLFYREGPAIMVAFYEHMIWVWFKEIIVSISCSTTVVATGSLARQLFLMLAEIAHSLRSQGAWMLLTMESCAL